MNTAKTLSLQHNQTLIPSAPLNFDATFFKPDHFPSPDNAWRPGIRWQTMRWRDFSLGLKFESRGSTCYPSLEFSIFAERALEASFLDDLLPEIEYRYNLRQDLSEFNERFQHDPKLGPVIERWLGLRMMSPGSLYEYLIISIVLQNATVRRSVQMMNALLESYGTRLAFDGQELFCFWKPEDIDLTSEDELRKLKVGYRARSIKRVSEAFARQQIDELTLRRQPYNHQRHALLELYGIGPASVGYILADVFHHVDEMEHISPWEQRIYSKLFFDREPIDPVPVHELKHYFDTHYHGFRSLAVHYFWEDLFWNQKNTPAEWLEGLIRL
jgi:3-methyladenine DNA glycosylase/8-oxoguanine DNA glycosylase